MKVESVLVNDDYAVLRLDNGTRFYYGYEVEGDDGWCFEARVNGNLHRASWIDLGGMDMEDCAENLLLGIGWLLEQGVLAIPQEAQS